MVLIIGGAYQGKTAYAQTKYALRDAEIFTCEGEALDLTARCLRHLERFALACVRAGKEPADVLAGLADPYDYFGPLDADSVPEAVGYETALERLHVERMYNTKTQ